jgi:hypothetical protein
MAPRKYLSPAAPLGRGVKPPCRARNCRELDAPEAHSRWEPTGGFGLTNIEHCWLRLITHQYQVLSDVIAPMSKAEALRLHFEAVVAAVVVRGKLKNMIKTFLGNPLCRGVDDLCTKQLESSCLLFADCQFV